MTVTPKGKTVADSYPTKYNTHSQKVQKTHHITVKTKVTPTESFTMMETDRRKKIRLTNKLIPRTFCH